MPLPPLPPFPPIPADAVLTLAQVADVLAWCGYERHNIEAEIWAMDETGLTLPQTSAPWIFTGADVAALACSEWLMGTVRDDAAAVADALWSQAAGGAR